MLYLDKDDYERFRYAVKSQEDSTSEGSSAILKIAGKNW